MKCEKCGELLENGDVFCTNCGSAINRQKIEPQQGSVGVQNATINPQVMQQQSLQPQMATPTQPVNPFAPQQLNPYQQALVRQAELTGNVVEDDQTANKLCGLSLFLRFGAPIIFGCIRVIGSDSLSSIASVLSSMSSLAAFVIMIVARIKYPNNKFAKVLMWLYIATIILYILLFVAVFVACISCASQIDY